VAKSILSVHLNAYLCRWGNMKFGDVAARPHIVGQDVIKAYVCRSFAEHARAFLQKVLRMGSELKSLSLESNTRRNKV
jgi:hypothetical protein